MNKHGCAKTDFAIVNFHFLFLKIGIVYANIDKERHIPTNRKTKYSPKPCTLFRVMSRDNEKIKVQNRCELAQSFNELTALIV